MQAQISLGAASFDDLTMLLRQPAPRPISLVMTIVQELSVSQDGLLYVEDSIDTDVTDIYWIMPVK